MYRAQDPQFNWYTFIDKFHRSENGLLNNNKYSNGSAWTKKSETVVNISRLESTLRKKSYSRLT